MDDATRRELARMGWEIHRVVEESYLSYSLPQEGDSGTDHWTDRRRLLLADMAIHLLQTAIKPGSIELDQLKNNLHAILTIADPFLPHADLKQATDKIYVDREQTIFTGQTVPRPA